MIDKKLYPRLAYWADKSIDLASKKAKEEMAKRAGVKLVEPPKPLLTRVVQNPYTWVGLGFLGAGIYVVTRKRRYERR